ncbi:gliding motility-associated C-terminal domain-containing protein [Solirubrum puertoriconensis]|uniref:PKD domain-containing protein n=1 Tax=Solirubrum puertoriconensis TaxID=1751427 RepID=A0A9X0HLL0_SOLP1|nr:gliding motility-associated C-terminal domain-containing protein [Solirubrum puertoriconensis]KUG08233.1 hypothetical protein ASU33_08600 [Solirubrum puertoriconensis]
MFSSASYRSLVACWLLLLTAVAATTSASAAPAPAQHLEFIPNQGQWPQPVRYMAPLVHGRMFLEATGWTYAFSEPIDPHTKPADPHPQDIRAHAVRMEFVNARPNLELRPNTPSGEVRNYLLGNDPKNWAQQVGSFREMRYLGVWPGIDVRLYENAQQQLEYDYEVTPGADVSLIQQRYTGAEQLSLGKGGTLQIRTSLGTVTELVPRAWQLGAGGERQPVSCRYVLRGQEVSFALGRYDRARPLLIDPTVVFSTFTGASADNWGFTATYDQQGNMYSGGIAFGLGYPTTAGAYSTTFGGNIDIAIIKYNTATTGAASRVWATYLGGSSSDYPQSLVVNNRGELVILSTTGSANYPTTTGAYDRTFAGGPSISPYGFGDPLYTISQGTDLAITSLNASGSALVGSTYLGGTSTEGLNLRTGMTAELMRNYGDQFRGDVLVDANDNIYIASNTASPDFPTRNNFQAARGAGLDAVVCKLTPTLTDILWSSYLGGGNPDAAYSLQLDAAGKLYVCGGTTSVNFPTTAGALQTAHRGDVDGFVVRISADGSKMERSTLLGTAQYDQAYFVQLDANGDVYLLGQSLGQYPVTTGRYINPNSRQFIHKLNAELSATEFSTVFGSGRPTIDISPTAFLVDQCNRIYVSGWGGNTNSGYGNGSTHNLATTAGAVQPTTDGSDFYLMQLAEDATHLEYATFFGGSSSEHVDGGTSRFDRRGFVYHAVCACGGSNATFPIPPGAGTYSTRNGYSNCNNAAFKFDFEPQRAVVGPDRDVCLGVGLERLDGSPAGGTWAGPGVSGSVSTGYFFDPAAVGLGQSATLTYTVYNNLCQSQTSLRLTVVAAPTVQFEPPQTEVCLNSPAMPLTATPAGGIFSGPGVVRDSFLPTAVGPGLHTITYTYTLGGCTVTINRQVSVVQAVAGPDLSICQPSAPVRLGGLPAGGTWTGQHVTGSAATGYFFAPPPTAQGSFVLNYSYTTSSGCVSQRALQAYVYPAPYTPTLARTNFCTTETAPVYLPGGANWSGRGVQGPGWPGFTFTPSLAGPGQHTLSYITVSGPCENRGTVVVSVGTPQTLTLPPDTLLCPGSTQPFRLRAQPLGGTWSGQYVTANGVFTPPPGFVGTATLTYTFNNGGCVSTATRWVGVAAMPAFAPRWHAANCPTDRQAPLQVQFSGVDASDALWDFGDGTTSTELRPTHVYSQPGRYQPKVIMYFNGRLCHRELQLAPIEVLETKPIPNIITPNADNKNDVFEVSAGCPPSLQVFSRWGKKVYEDAAYRNTWGGGNQPAGTYYYLLRYVDGRTAKGWLEIQR